MANPCIKLYDVDAFAVQPWDDEVFAAITQYQ
jgi:hypothetical protein